MIFFDVHGLLIRRVTPVRRGVALQLWNGERWVPYTDVDAVLRHGLRLTEGAATTLLQKARGQFGTATPLSEKEARVALWTPSV